MANPGLFLFIFVSLKHKFYRETVGLRSIRTKIVGVEDEHSDHLTTNTAQEIVFFSSSLAFVFLLVKDISGRTHEIPVSTKSSAWRKGAVEA